MRKVKSVVLFLMLAGAMSADAEIVLSKVFSDNMVLQREMPVPVWGWGEPGEKVTVKFKDQEKTAIADTDGKWIVRLDPLKASAEAQAMTISSSKITQSPDRSIAQSPNLQISNILVGDVWLCSGQSNMEFPVKESANATEDISHADYPLIRLLTVAHKSIPVPQNFIESTGWTACTPKDVPGFSAVGYFFGRKLFQELNIPIGLINSSRGGSAIETWTPPDGFANRSEIDKLVKEHKSLVTLDDKKKFMEKLCREDQFVASRYPQVKGQLPSWPEEKVIDYVLSDSYYTYKETCNYYGKIYPLMPSAIKGVIWYQGESNQGNGVLYAEKMKALVSEWRKAWGEGDFPFYFVQIAPFEGLRSLTNLWLGQYKAAREIKNCGMVSPVDITNLKDPHPRIKEPVGGRLALMALNRTYGRTDTQCDSPSFKALKNESDKIRISFDNVSSGGLVSRDGKPLAWFEIAGSDGKYMKADAVIDGKTVVVSSPDIKSPLSVRFAWNYMADPNLSDKNGLPVLPFDSALNQ